MIENVIFADLAAALDRSLPASLSVQLKGLIEYGIACGELAPGARLPSVRELAEAGDIAPMTAASVYKELRQRGLIVARPGAGTFVAPEPRGGGEGLARVQSHLDAALAEAEAAGMGAGAVAALLSARIGRSRAREARPVRLMMVGLFEDATRAYAQDIALQLKPGDSIGWTTLERLRAGAAPEADLYVTLANRKGEVEALLAGRGPVTSVSFLPSEQTRALLAAVDPMARLGLVSVFPEFLALMKPGVLRFAPHVRAVSAAMADDAGLEAFLRGVDVVVYATGAQAALARAGRAMTSIEYRNRPDPHAVEQHLLPQVEAARGGAWMLAQKEIA